MENTHNVRSPVANEIFATIIIIINYFISQDDKSVSERNLLFAAKNHEVTEFNIPTWEYLEKLMPPVTEEHK